MVSKHLQRYIDNFITMDIIATSNYDGSVMFYFTYCTQQKKGKQYRY